MSFPRAIDGPRLYDWATRSVAELSARRAEINALNVFPVPDADTGSNMAHTMEAALAEAKKLASHDDVAQVARALSIGSVRGARGNSGLVLSQVLRAIADAAVVGQIAGPDVAYALTTAVQLVDRAISKPVEGTIITVLRSAALAAQEAGENLHEVVTAAVAAARIALAKTPSQLDVLRDAGVVDAGGMGLLVLLEALLAEVEGSAAVSSAPTEVHGQAAELEIMFFFTGDLALLEQRLQGMGDSLGIARAEENCGSVHIHSRQAGPVIEAAFVTGQVTDLRLEVLPDAPQVGAPRRVVVAVTPAGSIAELYREAGAVVVTPGEDVVSEILAEVRTTSGQELILLPNGQLDQRQLVAVERATHAFEQTLTIVPTSRLVSGIAALTVHNPSVPVSVAAYAMTEAAAAMRTTILTECAPGETVEQATERVCLPLLGDGAEQVVVLSRVKLDVDKLEAELGLDVMAFPADGLDHLVEIGVE